MDRQPPRHSQAPALALLSTGLALVWGGGGWAEARLAAADELPPASRAWSAGNLTAQPRLTMAGFGEHAAAPERTRTRAERSAGPVGEQLDRTGSAAPQVTVRFGHHGDFERLAFEWPTPIDYDLVQDAQQVTIAFSRPGRIDLARIAEHLGGMVVDARADEGEVTRRVTLQVPPHARVRSLSLAGGRVVAVDVFASTAAQGAAPARLDAQQQAIQALRGALEQRDTVIESLLARVAQLERTVALSSGDLERVTGGRSAATPSLRATRSPAVPALEPSSGEPPTRASAARSTRAQAPEGTGGRQTAQAEDPAPGRFEIDEEAAERALDITLVQQGALLLPVGRAEFTPSFTYTRRTTDFPVVLGPADNQVLAEEEVRRNEFAFSASLLAGLPWDSQLELGLPYNLVEESGVDQVLGTGVQESSRTGYGLGDLSVGLAKTVLRERNWWPDVVLRVNWDTGTGEREDDDVVLGSGFQEVIGSVSLLKRQDPLVFVGGASYETVFEEGDIDPGDTLSFSLGTFLAASPTTSLRVVLNQSFSDELEVDGQSIDGSDQVQSVLTLGASAILGRNVLLDGAVGVGLTDDSPDYSVSISLPIRFSTPAL